jgi:SAM-dependent methyltransferase
MNEQAVGSNGKPKYFGRDLEAMSFAANYHKWIFEEFKPYLGDNVAEVGAGTGNFSKLIISAYIKHLVAIEPSANMYPVLDDLFRDNNQVKTVNHFFSDIYHNYENNFDSILYVNVLEHIENDQKELSYVYKTLGEKGHILIFVPALSWLYSDLDKKLGHCRRYHKQELTKIVQAAGFNIIKIKYFDIVGIIPWYIAFVLLKKSISGCNVALYDKLVVPIMRKIESVINPPIGKNLLLVGRKA